MTKKKNGEFEAPILLELLNSNLLLKRIQHWAGIEIVSTIFIIIFISYLTVKSSSLLSDLVVLINILLVFLLIIKVILTTRVIIYDKLYEPLNNMKLSTCSNCHGMGIVVEYHKGVQKSKKCPICNGEKIYIG